MTPSPQKNNKTIIKIKINKSIVRWGKKSKILKGWTTRKSAWKSWYFKLPPLIWLNYWPLQHIEIKNNLRKLLLKLHLYCFFYLQFGVKNWGKNLCDYTTGFTFLSSILLHSLQLPLITSVKCPFIIFFTRLRRSFSQNIYST